MKKHKPIKKKKSRRPAGLAPGSMIYIGNQNEGLSSILLIRYDSSQVEKTPIHKPEDLLQEIKPDRVNWIHVDRIHNVETIEKIGQIFNLHPLVLEDILNTNQRPKIEEYEDSIFVTVKIMSENTNTPEEIEVEQISFILGKNYLLSFKEIKTSIFTPILDRLQIPNSRIRNKQADYLLYALLDLIVDHYLLLTESMGDRIQELEEEINENQQESHLQDALSNKKDLLQVRKFLLPVKELIHKIHLLDSDLLHQKNKIYYTDIYDNLQTAQESLEMYVELNKNLRESYMSGITLKTNEIMKILTIISSLFIPLTFIVGVYGMNFTYMPELNLKYGYLYVWILMILIALGLLIFFKRKKWL